MRPECVIVKVLDEGMKAAVAEEKKAFPIEAGTVDHRS
jgi:hypothetical protein